MLESDETRIKIRETKAPSPSASRTARYRQRRSAGLNHTSLVVADHEIDGLVKMGFLSSEDRTNRTSVAAAVTRLVKQVLERNSKEATEAPSSALRVTPRGPALPPPLLRSLTPAPRPTFGMLLPGKRPAVREAMSINETKIPL